MDISLSPELEQFVDSQLSAGRYTSFNALISDALQMFKIQVLMPQPKPLDAAIQLALDDVKAGRLFSPEEVFASLKQKQEAWLANRGQP